MASTAPRTAAGKALKIGLDQLLAKGFFPKELPPCFRTEVFAREVTTVGLPATFRSQPASRLLPHSYTRTGLLRRDLAVPNPVHYFRLAESITDNWAAIGAHVSHSAISLSKPVVDSRGRRALTRKHDFYELTNFRALHRATAKYVLKADITECYQSIYTHSIPWAIHTRTVAKANRRNATLLGNVLDAAVRSCQHDQTIGIPIGPDTSLVIAEIILCTVDAEIRKQVRKIRGYRYVDDYELCCSTYSEAESMLSLVQSILLEYEMRLNPRKTRIIDLPESLEQKWSTELRSISVRNSPSGQYFDLVRFFDRAFEFAKEYPEDTVLKYAVERIAKIKLEPANWPILQGFFLQVMTSEPSVIPDVLSAFIAFASQGFQITKASLRECLNDIIQRHAPLGHDNEIAWAIWGALKFRLKLNNRTALALSELRNSFVVILALDAYKQGLLRSVNTSKWQVCMHQNELYDQQWLASYEANFHGWLPSNGPRDHLNSDPNFGLLKRRGVSFYEPVTSASTIPVRKERPSVAATVTGAALVTLGY